MTNNSSDPVVIPLGLSISDPDEPAVIVIGLVKPDGLDDVVMRVEARGYEESDNGAREIAEQLLWIARGIEAKLVANGGHGLQAAEAAFESTKPAAARPRPRFNPQPRGGK